MDWTGIFKMLGSAAIVIGAAAWVLKSLISHLLTRDLESLKDRLKLESDKALQADREKHDLALAELRSRHEVALSQLQSESGERLERVRTALQRIEHLEGDLIEKRGEAYGKIWAITGYITLFGRPNTATPEEISAALSDWYFARGWLLTPESKKRYFLLQEVLQFILLRSIELKRPSADALFSSSERPADLLKLLRARALQIEPRDDRDDYTLAETEEFVTNWKAKVRAGGSPDVQHEEAWLMLQFVMSAFRSCITRELDSRHSVQFASTHNEARRLPHIEVAEPMPVVSSTRAELTR